MSVNSLSPELKRMQLWSLVYDADYLIHGSVKLDFFKLKNSQTNEQVKNMSLYPSETKWPLS